MQYTERAATVRPDQQQCVLSLGNVAQGFAHVGRALHVFAIDLHDHISALQAGVVSRTAGLDLIDNRAVNFGRHLNLPTHIAVQVGQPDSPARLAVARVADFVVGLVASAHGFERDRHGHTLAVTQNAQLDGGAGLLLADFDLQFAGVGHLLAVEFADHVSDFHSSSWQPANRIPPA